MRRCRLLIIAFVLALGAGSALAKTQIDVELGWGGLYRPGCWMPAIVTVSDDQPRNALLEVDAPHGGGADVRIQQFISIGPVARQYPVYLPASYVGAESLRFVVRDATSGKTLARFPADDDPQQLAMLQTPEQVGGQGIFLGVSGERTSLRQVTTHLAANQVHAGYLPPDALPLDPIALQALDALVLSSPDFGSIGLEQQQAIAAWVRAGGSLIVWPGETPPPAHSPLIDILPAKIGSQTTLPLTDAQLSELNLPRRFGKLSLHELEPAADAQAVQLLPHLPVGYRTTRGLGSVTVAAFDVANLPFDDAAQTLQLWKNLLKGTVDVPEANSSSYSYGGTPAQTRQTAAMNAVVNNHLGNILGAGQFGFSYVAVVMVGLMLLVGPIDWFILRRTGRQPWTWWTTSGWIAAFTVGALYVGHVFKSGDLHFRTMRVIDQVDGATVGATEALAIYSPRTATYAVDTPPDGWWQPANFETYYGYGRGGAGLASPTAFQQSYRGNQPLPMSINVWNLRFLHGEQFTTGPAVVDAKLRVDADARGAKLVGTIRNLSATPLSNVRVKTSQGMFIALADPARLEPGAELAIDVVASPAEATKPPTDPDTAPYPQYDNEWPVSVDVNEYAGDLAGTRSLRIEKLMAGDANLARVTAWWVDPSPTSTLKSGGEMLQQHSAMVRATIRLESPSTLTTQPTVQEK